MANESWFSSNELSETPEHIEGKVCLDSYKNTVTWLLD